MAFCACGNRVDLVLVIAEQLAHPNAFANKTKIECCGRCARRITAAALRAVDVKRKAPAQQSLEGITPPAPAREPSPGFVMWSGYQQLRKARLEQLEAPVTADEVPNLAHLAALRLKWIAFFGEEHASTLIVELFNDWLSDTWGAGLLPAYPFRALASEKVWKARAEKLLNEAHRRGAH